MAVRHDQPKRRVRVTRSKNQLTKDYVEECKALQERILERRGGEPVPNSVDDIRAMREGDLR